MTNKINHTCRKCGNNEFDVQAKLTIVDKPLKLNPDNTIKEYGTTKNVIQVKCLECNYNDFLKENDTRCQQFFKSV